MNKIFALSALLLSTAVFAESTPKPAPSSFGRAVLYTGEVSHHNGKAEINNKTEFSIRKKEQFCWLITDLTSNKPQVITESFLAPASTNFIVPPQYDNNGGSMVTRSDNNRRTTIEYPATLPSNGQYWRCWQFEKTDPLGEYSLSLKMGETAYPEIKFHVVP